MLFNNRVLLVFFCLFILLSGVVYVKYFYNDKNNIDDKPYIKENIRTLIAREEEEIKKLNERVSLLEEKNRELLHGTSINQEIVKLEAKLEMLEKSKECNSFFSNDQCVKNKNKIQDQIFKLQQNLTK